MSKKTWAAVDNYIVDALFAADPALDAVLAANHDQGLPAINVSPSEGKLPPSPGPQSAVREQDPRDRHARRVQHDLAGSRTAGRHRHGWEVDHA